MGTKGRRDWEVSSNATQAPFRRQLVPELDLDHHATLEHLPNQSASLSLTQIRTQRTSVNSRSCCCASSTAPATLPALTTTPDSTPPFASKSDTSSTRCSWPSLFSSTSHAFAPSSGTISPRSLEKRASQALISHVDLPPERGSDGPSTVNICQPVNSDADSRHLPVTLPVLNWVAHPARSWPPLRRFFCSDVSCMPYR